MSDNVLKDQINDKAYIITGPTSGIGYATALELAKHGTIILVGRNQDKLQKRLRKAYFLIEKKNEKASEIYQDLGFEALWHFSFAFKKLSKLTPSELGDQRNVAN